MRAYFYAFIAKNKIIIRVKQQKTALNVENKVIIRVKCQKIVVCADYTQKGAPSKQMRPQS